MKATVTILAVGAIAGIAGAIPQPPHDYATHGVSCADCHTPYAGLNDPAKATGVANAASTPTSLVDGGKTWTVDEWVGGVVTFTSGPNLGQFRPITANTATALTWAQPLPAPLQDADGYRIGKTTSTDIATKCKSCHNPTGTAATMSAVGEHKTASGTIGCGKCHEPHNVAPNTGVGNGLLRLTPEVSGAVAIAWPSGGSNPYIVGGPGYNGVCESCHTTTKYHRNNASGDHTHNAGIACTSCHRHDWEFQPAEPATPASPNAADGAIAGLVTDVSGARVAGVTIATEPASATTTTGGDGSYRLSTVPVGAYAVTATADGYLTAKRSPALVEGGLTSNVGFVMLAGGGAAVAGAVVNTAGEPIEGAVVALSGTALTTESDASGQFRFTGVVDPGPFFIDVTPPVGALYLPADTERSVEVAVGEASEGHVIALSARPTDAAQWVGLDGPIGCSKCHADLASSLHSAAHNRSLTRIARDANGRAVPGAYSRVLNAALTTPRTVMIPLAGSISVAGTAVVSSASNTLTLNTTTVTGSGTTFSTTLQVGDVLGYMPSGLGWTVIGTVASIESDTSLTLAANAKIAATHTATGAPKITLSSAKYSVSRLSRTGLTSMLPVDVNDIVAPAWPGVKATNPNSDPNDPCIYGNAPAGETCAAGGTTKYADGQVMVYLCNLKDGASYVADEYVQKFGGAPYTCADGAFYATGGPAPAVPMVHIDVIYGGQGDKAVDGSPHPNMGVFKQRFQGRLDDIKAADGWSYSAGREYDSLTLPIQFLHSGDKVNGGYKMNGYHPSENAFPGESWSQQTRTFSHACAGCHNTGLSLGWEMKTVTIRYGRDGAPDFSPFTFAGVNSYTFIDENLTCEHCHGPGSEHVVTGGGKAKGIINPKHLTAESQRQLCGKCHAWDEGTNAKPEQDYGFEFTYNDDYASAVGGGQYVPGVYDVTTFFDNWAEVAETDEAMWDPEASGRQYGQAHRQQYVMLEESAHVNNADRRMTCTSCHDPHTTWLGTIKEQSASLDAWQFPDASYKNNVSCFACHAGKGDFASLSMGDVANVHIDAGGAVTKNGTAMAAGDVAASKEAIAAAVSDHMTTRVGCTGAYDPMNEAKPTGRCASCHMPKLAKSGGYIGGADAAGAKVILEGDQASHGFDVVREDVSFETMSRGGPSFQSGSYGFWVSNSGTRYRTYGFMPNSCQKCHTDKRKASLACPDTSDVWPPYWPFSEHREDPFWAACFTTTTAP